METARITPENAKYLFAQLIDQLAQADRQRMLRNFSLPRQQETLAFSELHLPGFAPIIGSGRFQAAVVLFAGGDKT